MSPFTRTAAARRAVILHGVTADDVSPDEADTLLQVAEIRKALTELGYRPTVMPVSLDMEPLTRLAGRNRPDVIFNLIEAINGQDRLLHLAPAVLESLGLSFTGCAAETLFVTSNKPLAKRLMSQAGIATPEWIGEGGQTRPDPAQSYIIKSTSEHASIGLDATSVVGGDAVPAALAERRARFRGDWFAERYIDGREFNISMLDGPDGVQILPIAEMTFVNFPANAPRIVDYAAKWDANSPAYRSTQRRFDLPASDAPLIEALDAVARDCWRLFGLRGYARVDVRVDVAGRPWVLEVNANPCLSADAGFMAAATRAGIVRTNVISRLIAAAAASAVLMPGLSPGLLPGLLTLKAAR